MLNNVVPQKRVQLAEEFFLSIGSGSPVIKVYVMTTVRNSVCQMSQQHLWGNPFCKCNQKCWWTD
jgi:hypothetical protein